MQRPILPAGLKFRINSGESVSSVVAMSPAGYNPYNSSRVQIFLIIKPKLTYKGQFGN